MWACPTQFALKCHLSILSLFEWCVKYLLAFFQLLCVCVFFVINQSPVAAFRLLNLLFSFRFCFLSQSIGNFYLLSYHSPSEFSHFCYLSLSDSLCLCHWVFVFSPSLSFTFINLIFTLNSAIICFFFVLLYINVSPLLSKSQHQIILFFVFFCVEEFLNRYPI